ncbi:DUF6807 family protein [Arthrobacter sp. SX1312]|uniref:DUF6807 family protein n=1 Tax=Arthrobacter sp. SX1312 TaxID=2058896 RepID=UPI000CE5731E|nr:DUF6807 family protein [Arthrobacter sp. SX1312]
MSAGDALSTREGRVAGVLREGRDEPVMHAPRPFLHPVLTPGGQPVSDYAPADHPWHWGLGITVSAIDVPGQEDPVNLWGGPTYSGARGYVQLPNNGSQRVRSRRHAGHVVVQRIGWCAADGSKFLEEERAWSADTLRAGDVGWSRTTVQSTWANVSGGPLAFGSPTTAGRPNAGYGGFFLRLAPSFDGSSIIAPSAGGAGAVGEGDAMGTAHAWLGLQSAGASVLMIPSADNPGGPSPWFVRSSGTPMLCAAPFFHEEMHLARDAVLRWEWSLLVADGAVQEGAFRAALGAARAAAPGHPA